METLLAVLALVVALARPRPRRPAPAYGGRARADVGRALPEDAPACARRSRRSRPRARTALRHLAVVRYDAFGDMGGHLSWSLALLDDAGDGVVLTSIHGRSEARTYAKNITGWTLRAAALPRGGGGDRPRAPLRAAPAPPHVGR